MSIRIALLGAALAVGSMGTAVAADSTGTSTQFGSEAEFVAKFGAEAQRTGNGQYRLQRGTTQYTVNFGAAALRATLDEVEQRLAHLSTETDGSTKANGERASLQQRRDELLRRLSISGAKAYDSRYDGISQCGFRVDLASTAAPQIVGGLAYASANVSSAGTIPSGGWHAVIGLYATAAAPRLPKGTGFHGYVYDQVSHDTYDNYTNPSRPAQAEVQGTYLCLRATSSVEVIAPSGYLWFPNYCGAPMTIVAQHVDDVACPDYF
jgi:hypothetical protein